VPAGDHPRDEDPVADRERVHVGADLGDEAHGLMAELDTLEAEITVVEVQIRSADRRLLDRHDHPVGPGSRASGTSSIPTDRSARRTAARTAARYLLRSRRAGAASGLGRPRRRRPGWLGRPGPTVMAHHEVALAHEAKAATAPTKATPAAIQASSLIVEENPLR